MDQHREYRSSWSYDNSVPPLPYHDFNHGGGFSNYNHPGRYQNHYQDVATEPTDSFGTAFVGRKRQFSQSAHGPPEYNDGGSCAKLYVRGVPREVTEQDIRSIFGKHGNIIEVVLFKELKSLHEQECCFVKYAKIEEATQAIRALHNHHTFPGGMRPIEVKYASKKQERPGCSRSVIGCLRTHECKVFVGFLNKQASKAEITEIFSPYGCVEDVFLLRDEYKQNRGIGFISFSHKDMAAAAIIALNGKYVMKGCDQPLVVRFADPKKPKTGEYRSAPYVSDPVGQTSLPNSSHMSSQTGSEPPSVSSTCSVATSSEMSNPPDCDWSEHVCPDGNAYYYNCVTCESRWEKPEGYGFHEQQVEKCNQQPWRHA
ncbi:flowering time control protein FCA isoform X1 [Cynara cardunculus var. scolymus]|uniref:Nucleotide-binding, alpha-beta plait n=1 Tax=Cynara cardunculus var. scolymus TaxID=59895 RepID=A0A118K7P0_CYNCS|nr:flowering time control protein FCA isoform X1 [Cynara cardunculus var. scolymus]KVI12543.1 Nucleotide-binding, alpha-beta plait [Cynara cardunculus var. scolymus]